MVPSQRKPPSTTITRCVAIPLAGENGACFQLGLAAIEGDQFCHYRRARLFLGNAIENLTNGMIHLTELIRLPPVTRDRGLQMLWQMRQSGSSRETAWSAPWTCELVPTGGLTLKRSCHHEACFMAARTMR